ncbi:MAG: hypothetical protein JWQ98_554 [Chlorobi bacterium]|nr:hypothetical protein [Chlorobiota bacterium]
MWGDRLPHLSVFGGVRFIPTHVGRSPRSGNCRAAGAVHPHACGEIVPGHLCLGEFPGSSPRMWGDLAGVVGDVVGQRFIPTHVGRSNPIGSIVRIESVHPHACGEIHFLKERRAVFRGSSPRMWGDRAVSSSIVAIARFIPTHVGRSSSSTSKPSIKTVHPHACGEILLLPVVLFDIVGSSPHMWGDLQVAARLGSRDRFIPTHVGRSPAGEPRKQMRPVHPHACGEITCRHQRAGCRLGSSPRMWGDPHAFP